MAGTLLAENAQAVKSIQIEIKQAKLLLTKGEGEFFSKVARRVRARGFPRMCVPRRAGAIGTEIYCFKSATGRP